MENLSIQQQLTKIQDRLLNFAYSLTEGRDEAEDLLQETSLRVLDNQEYFKENTNFLSWSFTVMKNIFLNNRIKMSRRYGVISSNYELYQLSCPSCDGNPEEPLNLEDITQKINSLPEELKEIFMMYASGYKYDEISEILSIPVGTVKSRLFKARSILQALLKEYGSTKKSPSKTDMLSDGISSGNVKPGKPIVKVRMSPIEHMNSRGKRAS